MPIQPIRIYDSLTRTKREFKPLQKDKVSMYVCGPTVYDESHIGHARSAYIFEVIRRYLKYKGYKVKFVRNVTDVDDKIIDKAKQEYKNEDLNAAVKKVADKYLKSYRKNMDELGIEPPDLEPKATDYINKMKAFIKILIKQGIAYESDGDVYFEVKKAKKYGVLSHQSLGNMPACPAGRPASPVGGEAGARITSGEKKKDPLDFALWKKAKENEPSWLSDWGNGRPGWHIECSVMSSDILGDEFDIHGGGLDLIFPHHENEIAQSEGAGKKFARYWMHHGLLTINGQKMSKSLGNFVAISDVLEKYPSDILKIFYLQAHYSSPIDFSWNKMEEAKKAYERIEILMRRLDRKYGRREDLASGGAGAILQFKEDFIKSMDDDFNTPGALSVLFDMVNKCHETLDSEENLENLKLNYAIYIIKELSDIFGLTFLKDVPLDISDDKVAFFISARETLKKEKKYSEADEIRKMLYDKGVILEDTKEGTTWRRKI